MNILTHIESHRTEYKQTVTDNFEKEVVAFLNYHEGGVIYIGVDNSGNIAGCQKPDEIQLKIKDKLKHNISPSCLGLFEVVIETIDEKDIMKNVLVSSNNILIGDQDSDQAILVFCKESKSAQEIMDFAGMKHKTYFRKHILNPLIERELLELTIPNKPKNPKQKYKTSLNTKVVKRSNISSDTAATIEKF